MIYIKLDSISPASPALARLVSTPPRSGPAAKTGKAVTISLWETREQMPDGIQDQGLPATGLTPPHLETYEVTVRA